MDKDARIAQILSEVLGGIRSLTSRYRYTLEDYSYPAREWSDEKVFEAFNGSALTDDPVYKKKRELSIYLRGWSDGEHNTVGNILGNLDRYLNMDVDDGTLERYQTNLIRFYREAQDKKLQRLLDKLDVESVDEAIVKIDKLNEV